MNGENGFIGNDKLEFRQIVLSHMRNILNLSLRSDRDGEKLTLYFNSIEALADILIPFYDEQMTTEIKLFEDMLLKIQRENREKKKVLSPSEYSEKYLRIYQSKKRSGYRNIFQKLNILLQRNDYLKSSVYGEDKDELGEEESEDKESREGD